MNTYYEQTLYPLQDKILAIIDLVATPLVGRSDPKDVVDLWIVATHEAIDWRGVFTDIASRAAGVFPPFIAEKISTFPLELLDTIKWIEGERPQSEKVKKDLLAIASDITHA